MLSVRKAEAIKVINNMNLTKWEREKIVKVITDLTDWVKINYKNLAYFNKMMQRNENLVEENKVLRAKVRKANSTFNIIQKKFERKINWKRGVTNE